MPLIGAGHADKKDVAAGIDLRVLAYARSANVFFVINTAADADRLSFQIVGAGLSLTLDQ